MLVFSKTFQQNTISPNKGLDLGIYYDSQGQIVTLYGGANYCRKWDDTKKAYIKMKYEEIEASDLIVYKEQLDMLYKWNPTTVPQGPFTYQPETIENPKNAKLDPKDKLSYKIITNKILRFFNEKAHLSYSDIEQKLQNIEYDKALLSTFKFLLPIGANPIWLAHCLTNNKNSTRDLKFFLTLR